MLFPVLQFRNEMPSNNGNAVIGLYETVFEVDAKATILLIEDVCRRNIGHTGIVRWHFKLRAHFYRRPLTRKPRQGSLGALRNY